jgi:archaellum biogenesis protein FlaJ (TadC family)
MQVENDPMKRIALILIGVLILIGILWHAGNYEVLFQWAFLVILVLTGTVIVLAANLKEKQKELERREEDFRTVIRHLEEQLLSKSESQETDD